MVPTHIPPIPAVTGHDDSELELEELSFSGRHFGHFLPTSRGGEERKVVILGSENFQSHAVFQVEGGVQRSMTASCNTSEVLSPVCFLRLVRRHQGMWSNHALCS